MKGLRDMTTKQVVFLGVQIAGVLTAFVAGMGFVDGIIEGIGP